MSESTTHRQPFLEGQRVVLRGLRPEDAQGPYPDWFNDEEVCRRNGHHRFPYTPEQAQEYIYAATGSRTELVLAIEDRASGRHIGNVSILRIDPISRSGEFAIVLGDREFWGGGYGTEAAMLIVEHAFEQLNLHRVHCGTFLDHDGMIRLAEAMGMRREGIRREAIFKDGRYHDLVVFGALREEFGAALAAYRERRGS